MYSSEMKWADWSFMVNKLAVSLIGRIDDGEQAYQKFYEVTYGLSDEQVSALPQFAGRNATDIAKLRSALAVLNEFSDALRGNAVATKDRNSILIPFV